LPFRLAAVRRVRHRRPAVRSPQPPASENWTALARRFFLPSSRTRAEARGVQAAMRSRYCRSSCAASSISLCRHSAAR
jgi:hypothetical protein